MAEGVFAWEDLENETVQLKLAVPAGVNQVEVRVNSFRNQPVTRNAARVALGEDIPHPRSYGNNARVLARYVREQRILTLEEPIRRMTFLPADTFHLEQRGRIAPGCHADLILFDPELVADPATFTDPHQYAEGFTHVLVSGGPVIRDGQLTNLRSGGPLKKANP